MSAVASLPPVTTPLHFTAVRGGVEITPQAAPKVDPNLLLRAEGSIRFVGEMQELNIRNAKLGAWFVMVLVPLCSVLDWFAYPHYFLSFLFLRLICSMLCVPLLLALDRPWAAKYHRVFPVILPLLPAMAICVMMYLSGDAGSGYYAGLILCLMGTSFVFHWTFKEIGITVALVMACYLAATVPNLNFAGGLKANGLFINNTLFILLTCAILYFGSRQHHGIRLREFVNRCKVEVQREELRERNHELTSTLKRLRDTEAQLTQSEKLASIGRLSAGIVHEINNPLNFVKSAIFVLKKKSKTMSPDVMEVQQILADIGEGVDRVAGIVSDLRTFAHPEGRGNMVLDLRQVADRAARLMKKQVLDFSVDLKINVPQGIYALGDENHLVQIFINLIQNSLDALEHRQEPIIEVSLISSKEEGILLSVKDNGNGIPTDVLERIFDPFFTTKEVGKGMGLGLSLCYRMMQGMGGGIEVRSEPGRSTEFILSFQPPA
ncbi:MAG: ATP-binding protein [Verrucomicrobiota bacterium]